MVDGGHVLVRAMREFGVSTIFTLHGGHLDSAYYAALKAGIKLVDTRHEQAAGLAAMGWARTTGQVGVAMVTAGGGVTNIVTAVTNAYADCVAMVIIGGAPPLRDYDALPVNSGYDQLSVMAGITKWSHRVTHLERLPDLVGRAFQIAREGRPGPVYLDVPSDVLFATIEEDTLAYPDGTRRVFPAAPAPEAVAEVLAMLREAKRPVIMAGGGVVYSQAAKSLEQFAERAGIPVLTNNKSRGAVPTHHPLWGRGFSAVAANAARGGGSPDVVLMLGARLGLYTGGRRKSVIPADAKLIQVDIKAEEIGRIRDVQVGITADCHAMLRALLEQDSLAPWPDKSEWTAALLGKTISSATESAGEAKREGPITPSDLAAGFAAAVPRDAILVSDGGETPGWLDAVAQSVGPNRWLGHGYLGIMGEGLPLAVGAQVAQPSSRVICFTGDGAIGFNFAEFDTMVRHDLPIVVVVNNDAQWGMSAHGQDLVYGAGNRMVSELRRTRYDLAAAGFGAYAEHVERIEDLAPALERALESGRPACINVMTYPESVAPVTRRFVGLAAEGLVSSEGKARVPYADILEV
jgi:acetolactate synthase I/II/III large subunit